MPSIDSPPLLRLPGKLRNSIYEYVSTESNEVIPCTGDRSNQLRLVCRQFYEETNWLELRCNNPIIFVRNTARQPTSTQQLVDFAKGVPATALGRLKTVILISHFEDSNFRPETPGLQYTWEQLQGSKERVPRVSESPSVLAELTKICRANPTMNVRYILPGFSIIEGRPYAAL